MSVWVSVQVFTSQTLRENRGKKMWHQSGIPDCWAFSQALQTRPVNDILPTRSSYAVCEQEHWIIFCQRDHSNSPTVEERPLNIVPTQIPWQWKGDFHSDTCLPHLAAISKILCQGFWKSAFLSLLHAFFISWIWYVSSMQHIDISCDTFIF